MSFVRAEDSRVIHPAQFIVFEVRQENARKKLL
jgi:hypothetical protein